MAEVFTIDDLNALTALTTADEIPVWDSEESGEPTKKITASNLAASVKSLGNLIGTGDLDSTPTSGSNKAVTSGGVYTAIQQSTAAVTKQVMTNSNGVANLGMTVQSHGYIVSAFTQDFIAIPFIVGAGGNWWIKILGWSNMAPYQGEVSVTVMTRL